MLALTAHKCAVTVWEKVFDKIRSIHHNRFLRMEEPVMAILEAQISEYLHYCEHQKKLSEKTIKAYSIDLAQFINHASIQGDPLSKGCIEYFARREPSVRAN
jgi:hypothetical protein